MKFMDFVRKIFSRKFWIAAAGVTTGVAMIIGATETEIGTVSGAVLALGSVASYIVVEGKEINRNINKVYYLLNKPRGVVSTSSDDKNRKTVVDLIDCEERIYPIGRLDFDTTGIMILTNDGELTNYLMHPKNKIRKTYLAKVEGVLDKIAIDKLKKNIIIDNRKVDIVDFKIKKKDEKKNYTFVLITIIEGRNHIVKKIFEKLGYPVSKLTRVGYDFLTLGNLQSGEYRNLTIKEVKKLYRK